MNNKYEVEIFIFGNTQKIMIRTDKNISELTKIEIRELVLESLYGEFRVDRVIG